MEVKYFVLNCLNNVLKNLKYYFGKNILILFWKEYFNIILEKSLKHLQTLSEIIN